MFSSRFRWDLRPNRIAQALEARRRAGSEILDLTESNPTRGGFDYPVDQILRAFADPQALHYEPSPAGLLSAREAVAAYYSARDCHVHTDRILLTTSTSESYAWLFKLLADAEDQVLVPRPSYPLFEFLAEMEMVQVEHYPLVYHDGWSMDLDAIALAITDRTRALVLVNPNNPTGSFVKRGELERLVQLAAARNIALISDEVFTDYTLGPDPNRVSSLAGVDRALTFCLSGVSKVAGLPQMKLGWIIIGGPSRLCAQATERLELIADTYLSVGTPVQHALPQLLSAGKAVQRQIAARVQHNLAALRSTIHEKSSAQVLNAEGGWYGVLRVPLVRTEEEWCLELLEGDGVLIQPGFFYDFDSEAFLVLSLLTPPETFRAGVQRIMARL
ncbi:MAG: pyridoxal phosphate-dependent aminotransferase [Acidobacteria bacterium]|nr:MAG: pyridoxal phosphate-dependent aminotransferase [Acidobacteriota bacterium]